MKYSIFFLLITLYYPSFEQQSSSNIYQLIEKPIDTVSGIYSIEERTLYNKDKIEFVYPNQIKFYINTTQSYNAINLKNNEVYFSIKKNGSSLTITDESFSNVVDKSLFNADEFELKLYYKTDNNSFIIYKVSRLKKIDDIFDKIVQGTGVIISKTGYVVTNSHVINEANLIKIQLGTVSFNASVIYNDTENDIALLAIQRDKSITQEFTPLYFNNSLPLIGDDVLALGFPLLTSMGYELKLTTGTISSLKGIEDDNRYLQFTAPIDPGNSGCPLLNSSGEVIGIVSAKHSIGTNVGYALKTSFIPNAISKYFLVKKNVSQPIPKSSIYLNSKKSILIIKSFYL